MTSEQERTVAFVDLTGYTSLNDTHGDAVALEVVDRFLAATRRAVEGRGRIVKTLGDGVLLDFADPAGAVGAAAAISDDLHDLDGMPELTCGIATGAVIDRDGDIFGSTVNLAARLADLARPGELRATQAAAGAASAAGWTVEVMGPTTIRGLHQPVPVHRVLLCAPEDCVVDPVCGMRITPRAATPHTTVDGQTIWFCTATCADRFSAAPGRYRHEAWTRG